MKASDMVTSNFGEFFVVIGESAATLIGLLFVAVTVTKGQNKGGSLEIVEFRAAASLIAFTNALVVSLFGLVPGNNIGYPALIMGVIGVFFVGAGVRTTLASLLHCSAVGASWPWCWDFSRSSGSKSCTACA